MCLMHFSDEYGVLITGGRPWTIDEAAAALRGGSDANSIAIQELLDKGVAKRDKRAAIYSGRMIRDNEVRVASKGRMSKFREKGGGDPERWTAIRIAILERDAYMCAYCGKKANTVDHVTPRSKGGTEATANLVACCKGCNFEKGNRTLEQAKMRFWCGYDTKHLSDSSVTPIYEDGNGNGLSNIPTTIIPLKEFSLDDFDGEMAFMRHYAIWQKHESYAECGHPAKFAYMEAVEREGADKKVGRKQAAEYLDGRADLYLTTMPRKFHCGMTRWLKEGIYSQNEAAWRERGGGTGSKKASLNSYAD